MRQPVPSEWLIARLVLARLNRIETMLATVLEREEFLMATEADLDAALTTLGDSVNNHIAAVNSLIEKLNSGVPAADLSDEIASVQTLGSEIQTATEAIGGALNPPAEPPA